MYLENYNLLRNIEFKTLINMSEQHVLPAAYEHKKELAMTLKDFQAIGYGSAKAEAETLATLGELTDDLHDKLKAFKDLLKNNSEKAEDLVSKSIAHEILPASEKIAEIVQAIEDMMPDQSWPLPKHHEMLFLR